MTKFVRTGENLGPRGDYYSWCKIDDKGYPEFGEEQGNYAGGATLSRTFYGKFDTRYPDDHIPTQEYWTDVENNLKYWKKKDVDFYNSIVSMFAENNIVVNNEGNIEYDKCGMDD